MGGGRVAKTSLGWILRSVDISLVFGQIKWMIVWSDLVLGTTATLVKLIELLFTKDAASSIVLPGLSWARTAYPPSDSMRASKVGLVADTRFWVTLWFPLFDLGLLVAIFPLFFLCGFWSFPAKVHTFLCGSVGACVTQHSLVSIAETFFEFFSPFFFNCFH